MLEPLPDDREDRIAVDGTEWLITTGVRWNSEVEAFAQTAEVFEQLRAQQGHVDGADEEAWCSERLKTSDDTGEWTGFWNSVSEERHLERVAVVPVGDDGNRREETREKSRQPFNERLTIEADKRLVEAETGALAAGENESAAGHERSYTFLVDDCRFDSTIHVLF